MDAQLLESVLVVLLQILIHFVSNAEWIEVVGEFICLMLYLAEEGTALALLLVGFYSFALIVVLGLAETAEGVLENVVAAAGFIVAVVECRLLLLRACGFPGLSTSLVSGSISGSEGRRI